MAIVSFNDIWCFCLTGGTSLIRSQASADAQLDAVAFTEWSTLQRCLMPGITRPASRVPWDPLVHEALHSETKGSHAKRLKKKQKSSGFSFLWFPVAEPPERREALVERPLSGELVGRLSIVPASRIPTSPS